MQAFANNPDVAFGDVNLAEDQVRETKAGGNHNPGEGGWPTVKYFNKETGYEGKPYKQKTSDAMCDELGNDMYMQAHIEEAGETFLCRVSDGKGCGEKEVRRRGPNPTAPSTTARLLGLTRLCLAAWVHSSSSSRNGRARALPTLTRRSTASTGWRPPACVRSSRAGCCSVSPSSSRSSPRSPRASCRPVG